MSNAKEIRGQIKSVKNTQKITRAMEMVAASKIKRVQDQMRVGRPYTENILRVIAHLVQANSEEEHLFLTGHKDQEVKKVGYILISTDRGLCGGLNINLFKHFLNHYCAQKEKGREVVASVFGRKGVGFLNRLSIPLMSVVENYPEQPEMKDLIGGVRPMIEAFVAGEVQKIFIVHNFFVNAMAQKPNIDRLLPATIAYGDGNIADHSWDYLYDSKPDKLLNRLMRRYIESVVRQSMLENIASEMSARMIAMKNASDNAGSLIDELQLKYNKARQAAITQELTEIVAGADAV